MNRPLIFYFFTLILSSLTSVYILTGDFISAVIVAASFFIIIFFTQEYKYCFLIFIIFILGIFNFYRYFNISLNSNKPIQIRLIEKSSYMSKASYGGKKIMITGNLDDTNEGELLIVSGNYDKKINYADGSLGEYSVKNIITTKKDMFSYMYSFKNYLSDEFVKQLGKEKASILNALCFGDTRGLSTDQKNDMKQLGIVHAVSVSGLHVAIVYSGLQAVFGFKIALILCFIYVIFTGFQSSAIRAFVMIFIHKFAKKVFRNYDGLSALSLSGILLVSMKPFYIFDLGFMLSFLATLGILLYYKKIRRYLFRLPKKLNETISISLSAQAFTFPYICFTIRTFSLAFLLGNILILPIFTYIVILGNIALIFIWLKPVFTLLNYVLYSLLTACEGLTSVLVSVSPQLMYTTYIEGVGILLIFFAYLFYKRGYKQFKIVPIIVMILIAFQNYSFFTEVVYYNYKSEISVVIREGNKSIFITRAKIKSMEEEEYLKKYLNVYSVIDNFKKESINYKNSYDIINIGEEENLLWTNFPKQISKQILINGQLYHVYY